MTDHLLSLPFILLLFLCYFHSICSDSALSLRSIFWVPQSAVSDLQWWCWVILFWSRTISLCWHSPISIFARALLDLPITYSPPDLVYIEYYLLLLLMLVLFWARQFMIEDAEWHSSVLLFPYYISWLDSSCFHYSHLRVVWHYSISMTSTSRSIFPVLPHTQH